MKNVQTEMKDKMLTITIDLSKRYDRSASGKTIIIASTEGNQPLAVDGDTVYLGVNVYCR